MARRTTHNPADARGRCDTRELVKLVVAAAALLAWMAFIFYMSAKTGGASGGMSESVAAWLAQLFCPDWASMSDAARAELLSAMSLPVRKAAHVTEYAILAVLAFTAFWQIRAVRRARTRAGAAAGADKGAGETAHRAILFTALAAFAFSALYAASDEFHQLFVPGRAGLLSDVAIDSCGAALGSALAALVVWRRRARRRGGKERS